MNIVYLTTHVADGDFSTRSAEIVNKPNPAGQNFHGKLIRALGENNNVQVYSLVPMALGRLDKDAFDFDHNIHYSYIYAPKNKYVRALLFPPSLARRIVEEQKKPFIVIYDSLNYTLAKVASLLVKKAKAKRIAVLTDDIANITGVGPAYQNKIREMNLGADGSISLTEGLVQTYKLGANPSYIQPIYVEEVPYAKPYKHPRPYIYYGGALFEKDGTKDLIEAFNQLPLNYDLVLAGHGAYESKAKEAANQNERIIFLGQVDKDTHYSLIAGSALAINPRHYRKELDECAVPSKVMEYLSLAKHVASTLSTPIKNTFGNDINWIDGPLNDFLKGHLDADGNLVNLIENKASDRVIQEYGKTKSAKDLQRFLINFLND